jgi:hypothetical protein
MGVRFRVPTVVNGGTCEVVYVVVTGENHIATELSGKAVRLSWIGTGTVGLMTSIVTVCELGAKGERGVAFTRTVMRP